MKNEKQKPPPLDGHYVNENGDDKPPTSIIVGPLTLAKYLYSLSPPEVHYIIYKYQFNFQVIVLNIVILIILQDLTLATMLVRSFPLFKINDPKFKFTGERFGTVKRAFVVTEDDLAAPKKFQMWMVENNPPDITVEIRGSDHMAMVSKPLELADGLQRIVQQLSPT